MSPIPIDQARSIVHFRDTCSHESGHCAASLLLGLDIDHVEARHVDHTIAHDPSEEAGHLQYKTVASDHAGLHNHLIAILAGGMTDPSVSEADWPPRWDRRLAPDDRDEATVWKLVEHLGIDEPTYEAVVRRTQRMVHSDIFDRLHKSCYTRLVATGRLDEDAIRDIAQLHLGERKAVDTTVEPSVVESGEFEATAALWTEDREKDVVMRGEKSGDSSKPTVSDCHGGISQLASWPAPMAGAS
jgi:hypothetical protein